jgi:hypothetical protein
MLMMLTAPLGPVLVNLGEWPAAELTIEADHGVWHRRVAYAADPVGGLAQK